MIIYDSDLEKNKIWKTKYITRTKMSFIRQSPQKELKGEGLIS
jgi:hypothetical protein